MTDKLPKIAVFTLGCKVNLYDSDAMLAVFKRAGFEVEEGLKAADIYVINTCAVTAEAEKKSRQAIARVLKINPQAEIYVCGCASQRNSAQFEKERVRFIFGTAGKLELAENIVKKYAKNDDVFCMCEADRFETADKFENADGVLNLRTRHFIKVQDGCNNFCSYCIVPYLRGRSRSRELESILSELDRVRYDVKEVVASGINLSAYGQDIGLSLADLLRAFARYEGLRFRLGSLEVGVIDDELLSAAKDIKGFCPHFHLSLQSGDNDVLKAMNRHYTAEQYAEKAELIRKYFDGASITTDIIVGFPTETDEAFENCLRFAEKVAFADIHVFPYSSRKGTVAGKLKTQDPTVVAERVERMTALKHKLAAAYLTLQLDKPQEVLFETCRNGIWQGHTPNYIKAYSSYGAHNEIRTILPTALYNDGVCDDSIRIADKR